MSGVSWLLEQWRSPTGYGPRVQLAAKTALAAGIAWGLAELFPSEIDQYAYYGPLGAVLAMYPTLVSSVHAAVQTVLGILIGATIALAVDTFLPANALTVALLVGAGILAGVVPWLGEQRGWVPITALFVFTIADPGSLSYAVGYVGLTLIGVTVGTVVNFLVFPPLHLRATEDAVRRLQEIVSDQLEDLAEGLEADEAPDRGDWEQRTRAVSPTVTTMQQALLELSTSTRGNPRAWRHRRSTEEDERAGRAFQHMALRVEDLVNVLAETEGQDVPALPFNDQARLDCAAVMRRLAELARLWPEQAEEDGRVPDAVTAACQAMDRLERSIAEDPSSGGADPFVAGSVVTGLRRCLGAMISCRGGPLVQQNRSRLFQ